ncbi:YecA family protein [Actinomycetospora aeridis]|uniref:SEC-C domain-containing protein n=1 Tax=Actinomycetospora aeridis TaxID=3129231 RepID=A0ABU8N638_9PSEU
MASLLTTDDLDGLGADAMAARDARPYVRELIAAVDEGRLADADDAGYALSLAADIADDAGDQEESLALSARSVTAGEATGDAHWLRAMHADRLLRLGHDDEGMTELTALRPLLHREASTVIPIVDALTENGRGELAEQWLTAALQTAVEREERLAEGSEEQLDAADVVDELLVRRRFVRSDLGLPPDEYDALADEMDAAPDLVFLPEAEHARLLGARPDLADEFGADWDTHRAIIEVELQIAHGRGEALQVEVASPAVVTAMLDDTSDADPVGVALAWPPGRNDPCWCGSRTKYKKCCLHRGRAGDDVAALAPKPVEPPPLPPAVSPAEPETRPTAGRERVIKRGTASRPRAR